MASPFFLTLVTTCLLQGLTGCTVSSQSPRLPAPGPNTGHPGQLDDEFVIYQNCDSQTRATPAIAAAGAEWMPVLPNWIAMFWAGGDWLDIRPDKISRWIEEQKIPDDYAGRFVIDYEPWINRSRIDWAGGERPLADMIDAMIKVVDAVRTKLPESQIGWYGIPAIAREQLPRGSDQVEVFAAVFARLDFCAVQLYTSTTKWHAGQENEVRRRMKEANRTGLPVIPFVLGRATGLR